MSIWKYIKADSFFADFLPHIKSHKFKIRGSNSRNNPIDFSKEEMKEINSAIKKLPPVRKKQGGNNNG
jgi:hypothetical protein